MNKYLSLTRVLFKSNTGLSSSGGGIRRKGALLVVLALCMLPLMVPSGVTFYMLYPALAQSGGVRDMLAGMMAAACGALIIFGIMYVISTFYFSDDVAQLITMPIEPETILAAKFTIVCVYQYFVELVIMLPCAVAFGLRIGSAAYFIYAFLMLAALPLIPTVICAALSVVLMAFGKIFRNKDRFRLAAGIVAVIFAVGVNLVIQLQTPGAANSGADTSAMLASSLPAMSRAAMFFPTCFLAADGMLAGTTLLGFAEFVAFLAACAAAVFVFLRLAHRLYLIGVVGLSQSAPAGRRMTAKEAERMSRGGGAAGALISKDMKLLLRTPSYMLNCVLGAVVFPPLMVIIFAFAFRDIDVSSFAGSFVFIAVASGMMCFFGAMNMASATAVSRDGKNYDVSRYIPVPARSQVLAKLIPGLVLSGISLLLMAVPAVFIFRIGPLETFWLAAVSAAATCGANLLGLLIDISFPKLDWEDENAAVKSNLNVGVELILITLLLCALPLPAWLLPGGTNIRCAALLCEWAALGALLAALLFGRGARKYISADYSASGGRAKKSAKLIGDKPRGGQDRAPREEKTRRPDRRRLLIALFCAAAAAAFVIFMVWEFTATASVTLSAGTVKVDSGMESSSFSAADITDVYVKDSMPDAAKINGFNSGAAMRGLFTVEGLGKGHVYTQTAKGPFLYVILRDGGFYIFNFSDTSEMQSLEAELEGAAGK
jgi:ABC-2 type transport system permease protein